MRYVLWMITLGFTAGVMSGLLGVGGGVILVPAMVYLLHMTQHEAHGVSLAVILFIAVSGVISYSLSDKVDWATVARLALGGVIGAPVGAWIAGKLSARRLRGYFGLFLLLVGLRMVFDVVDTAFIPGNPLLSQEVLNVSGAWRVAVVVAIGLATGVLSGLLGVGGGVFIVPALVLILGAPQQVAQGDSLAAIMPISVAGAIAHHQYGNIRTGIIKWLAIGGVAGSPLGGQIAVHLNPLVLQGIFSLLLLFLGAQMALWLRGER